MQSRLGSFVEAWANIAIGFGISFLAILAAADAGEVVAFSAVVVTDDGAAELVVCGDADSTDLAGWTDELSEWLRSEQPIG